jgi:hypothetical protein
MDDAKRELERRWCAEGSEALLPRAETLERALAAVPPPDGEVSP